MGVVCDVGVCRVFPVRCRLVGRFSAGESTIMARLCFLLCLSGLLCDVG